MDKKTRVVLDAGDDTALFVEQEGEGVYLAAMYPFRQSDLTLRMWKEAAFSVFSFFVLWLILASGIYGIWMGLNTVFPDHSFVAGFVCVGLLFSVTWYVRMMFQAFKKDLKENQVDLVRRIMRDMRRNSTAVELEKYFIKSSYLYNGMDGDFITWYKQEKNKQEVKNSRRAF